MMDEPDLKRKVEFSPVTAERWRDLETLFGERGACGGCWCMWWKLTRSEFEKHKGEANKQLMKSLVRSNKTPGVLAFVDHEPIGWCAVGPREDYPALERSRILKPVDDKPVWSVVCFYIEKRFRNQGLTTVFLEFILEYCRDQGAKIVEGYPVEPRKTPMPSVFAWTGIASAFRKAGFHEVARRSPTRPVMRCELS